MNGRVSLDWIQAHSHWEMLVKMTPAGEIIRRLAGLRFLPARWQLPGFLAIGITAGSGLFVMHISRAASYLSNAPETCMNCHVMTTQYVTWQHSSHGRVATCNDCHVPHTSLAAQYGFKAQDGLWHATVFTMRWEPQVIRLSERRAGGREQLPPLPCRRAAKRIAGRPSAWRPPLLGLSPRGAAWPRPQPGGHARCLPAATPPRPQSAARAPDWRASRSPQQGHRSMTEPPRESPPVFFPRPLPAWRGWAVMIAALAVTFGLGILAASILEPPGGRATAAACAHR